MTSRLHCFAAALLAVGPLLGLAACSDGDAPPLDVPPDVQGSDAAPDGGVIAPEAGGADAAPDLLVPNDGRASDAANSDATPDMGEPRVDGSRDGATDATDATDAIVSEGGARDGVSSEPAVDAAPDLPTIDAATDVPGSACYWQGPNGPLPCSEAYTGGKGYCKGGTVCTRCEAEEWLNCDGNDVNGCEVFIDENNCGACGRKCSAIQYCTLNSGGVYTCQRKPDAG